MSANASVFFNSLKIFAKLTTLLPNLPLKRRIWEAFRRTKPKKLRARNRSGRGNVTTRALSRVNSRPSRLRLSIRFKAWSLTSLLHFRKENAFSNVKPGSMSSTIVLLRPIKKDSPRNSEGSRNALLSDYSVPMWRISIVATSTVMNGAVKSITWLLLRSCKPFSTTRICFNNTTTSLFLPHPRVTFQERACLPMAMPSPASRFLRSILTLVAPQAPFVVVAAVHRPCSRMSRASQTLSTNPTRHLSTLLAILSIPQGCSMDVMGVTAVAA